MSSCRPFEQALLDEAAPRPPGFEEHLASCPSCAALGTAHRSALRLRGATLSAPRRRPLAEVQRRAGMLAGLLLALGGSGGLVALELETQSRREREVPLVIIEDEQSFFALAQLQISVSAQLSRDPREDEAAVRVFGALPRWTMPVRTEPMRSLGRAASPLTFTSEDSP